MNPITFSKIEFSVHPTGSYTGTIISVDDKGKIDTQYGLKHKITVRVESNAANNGSPHALNHWLTVSAHPKSNLTAFREMVLGRSLTESERTTFDQNELLGKSVGYEVSHRESGDRLFANVIKIWPITDDPTDETQMDDDIFAGENPLVDDDEDLFKDVEVPF